MTACRINPWESRYFNGGSGAKIWISERFWGEFSRAIAKYIGLLSIEDLRFWRSIGLFRWESFVKVSYKIVRFGLNVHRESAV